jgi:oligopeptide transport system substrate-binding protein
MMRLLLIPAVMLALLGGAMVWSGSAAEKKADFVFINRGEVTSLDPNRMSWMQDIRIGYALWEGLYTIDPVTLDAIPGSAFPIDVSPDKTVYTFHIRPDAKWSNGDDLLARDFIFSWRRMLEIPGEYTYLLYYIQGAKEYQEAFATDFTKADFSTVKVQELGPKILKVTLIHPVAPFPDICAMPAFYPLNEKSMAKFLDRKTVEKTGGRVHQYELAFTLPPNLVTNGPYELTKWEFKRRMRLEANKFYWDKASVKSPIIDQVSADDIQWAYAKYQSGGIDWIAEFDGDIAAELYKRHFPDLHVFPAFGTYFYSFNCQPKLSDGHPNPFADVRVRQAFTMSIDKRVIVDTITRLGQIPSTTYIPVGSFANYVSPPGLAMNIPAARKLLADAGYPDGKGFPPISLLFNNEFVHGPIAENIRRQWLENLGVDIKLEGIEIKMFRERLHNKDYAVARASWYGDYNDPSTFTDKYKPDSENNDSGWINAEYADLCKKADYEPDKQKRLIYFQQAENILLNEAPILPLYTYVGCYLYPDYVTGIPLNPRQMLVLKSVKATPAPGK